MLWILASIFTLGFNLTLLYWLYVWGAYMGNNNVQKWGVFFGISTCQDVCVVEFCKCFLLTVGAIMSVRPQLRAIRRVINDICMQVVSYYQYILYSRPNIHPINTHCDTSYQHNHPINKNPFTTHTLSSHTPYQPTIPPAHY